MDLAFAVGAFAMFVVLWIGFAFAILGDPRVFDPVWQWLRELPLPAQVVVWLVFLPLAVGLWIWESSWSTVAGILLTFGMIAWTFVAIAGLVRAVRAA